MTLRDYDRDDVHPLDFVQAIVTAAVHDGFIEHMASRGVHVVLTTEVDAQAAAQEFFNSQPPQDARTPSLAGAGSRARVGL